MLVLFLACGIGMQAQTHYKPGTKKSSFEEGDKFFMYCTALVLNGNTISQDRTGFLANGGNSSLSLIKQKPFGTTNFHYTNGASVWTVASVETVDGCIKLSVKPLNSNKYLNFDGATNNAEVQYIYLRNWASTTAGKPGTDVGSETGNNAFSAHASLTVEDNLFMVCKYQDFTAGGENENKFWNGNEKSFAKWTCGYPYAFYTAEDASTEYAPMLQAAQAELNTLISNAKPLVTSNYSVTSSTALTLSTTNLTTNADQNSTTNADYKDGGGIAALFDGETTGNKAYWHSSWGGGAEDPHDWHYLQVDAGALIDGFNFSYSTRDGGEQNPTSFEIQASVDGTDFDHVITLDEANDWMPGYDLTYKKSPVTYNSYDIAFRKQYRYVRFVCKSNTSGTKLSGYPIFALSEFSFNKLSFGASTTTNLQKIRYARLKKALSIAEAADVSESTTCMVADVEAVKNELNVHYLAAQRTPVPSTVSLTLTTDESSPVLYHINSGRASDSYFTYKALNNGMIKLERLAAPATNIYGYWYFMENPKTGYVQLYAYTEPGAPIGYREVSDGSSKLTNVSTTQNPIVGYDYEVVASNHATYPVALKPAGYNTYVSNHGGEVNFMGFYNGLNDGGTRFALVSVEVPAAGDKLIELAQAYKSNVTVPLNTRPADSKFGTTLNTLDVNWKNSFDNTIGLAINSLLTAANTVTSDDVETAMSKMSSLSSSDMAYFAYPRMNQPTPGKFYRFKSVKHNTQRLRSDVGGVYTASDATATTNRLLCGSTTDNGRNSIFYLDENNNLVAYVEGQYVQFPSGAPTALTAVGGTGTTVSFMPGKDHASYRICNSAGRSVYCKKVTKDAKDYYFWDFGGVSYGHTDNGYDWTIEEVEWLPVGVNTTAGYGTLKSPVALRQTDDNSVARITAYTGNVDGSTLRLSPIEGNIPAGTPVVFKYNTGEEDGNVFLKVMTDETAAPSQNLKGSYVTLPKSTAEAGKVVYTLQQIGGNTGFYQYSGANIQGFRAYLSLNNAVAAGAIGLEFDNAVTGIDEIVFDDDVKQSNIYDLSGRRVNRMTKGMYIVNGQKVLIK